MTTSHRQLPTAGRLEIQRHLVAALDEMDVDLLAGVAQACADQIRAFDRMLNPDQDDFRLRAERLDHLAQLMTKTNAERHLLTAWESMQCAYCGDDMSEPVQRKGRRYCDEACAEAAA